MASTSLRNSAALALGEAQAGVGPTHACTPLPNRWATADLRLGRDREVRPAPACTLELTLVSR